jgi:hypothetical protein
MRRLSSRRRMESGVTSEFAEEPGCVVPDFCGVVSVRGVVLGVVALAPDFCAVVSVVCAAMGATMSSSRAVQIDARRREYRATGAVPGSWGSMDWMDIGGYSWSTSGIPLQIGVGGVA